MHPILQALLEACGYNIAGAKAHGIAYRKHGNGWSARDVVTGDLAVGKTVLEARTNLQRGVTCSRRKSKPSAR